MAYGEPIPTIVSVDLDKPAFEQPGIHNRWHPDIPACYTMEQNKPYKIECFEWTGGQIKNNDSADDIKYCDLTRIHYLSGPFAVESAEPGDVLVVEIQDVQPLDRSPWGYCGVFAKENGGGFLDKFYPKAAKAVFDFEGIHCSSRHLPGVRFAGLIHPGIIGTAPSAEVLEEWNSREKQVVLDNPHSEFIVANPPCIENTFAGSLADSDIAKKVAAEGARTIPGRPENGGNCDIKNLSRGSKVYLPVHVKGANLSVGDLHFSQGDGEISFCGAIEMNGCITLKCSVIKGGMSKMNMKSPMYLPGPVEPHYGPNRYLTFEGFSVDETGKQFCLDTTVAYRETCLRVIEYLRRYGYNDYQIYLLLSTAPIQGHVAGIVDIPNSCTTIGLPMDIFDFDISPESEVVQKDMKSCAFATDDLEKGFPVHHIIPNRLLEIITKTSGA
ncbi:unnamed protein product [Kuraishia capsulata CBS 1993]|uniref:Formamidase n=1 Tax=Kuraishia capsulata CBS 1993 TaxID=1382522 RepID=W6MMN7_9ASCO|nr:uncharacterized protein KUCA_T00003451001 [Kuraishia capsulata CBS 1993]CDK27473.1 unnamed protein product [Kuraishia capsulata CBS 1993]